jgi:hypothetical protein
MNQKARPKTEVTKNPPAQGSGPQGKIRRFVSAGMRWVVLVVLFLLASCLLASCLLGLSGQAQTPGADPYEPDDPGTGDPPWIGNDETQQRSFYPDGDVDRARFRVKAGHWYDVHTQDLAHLVDTFLTVEVGAVLYEDDDGGAEPLASLITFQAVETTDAIITIVNNQGVYSTTQTYNLYAGEIPAPTPTPTLTPLPTDTPAPTSTPRPTDPPLPTATPANPIISFSATPDRVERPGDCVTLRWHVERATEVYLVLPNGNREGVIGEDERQVCPLETSVYALKVYAPGGDETVEVQVSVPLPTPTPTPKPANSGGSAGGSEPGKGTVHVVVFVDENRSDAYDPQEGVLGAVITLMSQADPGQLWTAATDTQGQAHLQQVPSGSYTLLIPHLGYAETVSFRGDDLTLDVLVAPIRLPSRIP